MFKFDENGLIPVIAQDYKSHKVLMLAYMNQEAFDLTLKTGKAHYYSRSRKEIWLKGETSGHFQYIVSVTEDCDRDALLLLVDQIDCACHTGDYSCFHNSIQGENQLADTVRDLYKIIQNRKESPREGSYTNYLFDKGIDKILKKVGEESAEVIIAAKNNDKQELVNEMSDLVYHLSVLLVNNSVEWDDIYDELEKRKIK